MNTDPSPNADLASLIARCICSSNSSAFSTTRIPFPPPPADAFIRIGKPISCAIRMASFSSAIAPSLPGTKGILYFFAAAFAESLSPIISIDSGDGPINVMPACFTLRAKSAFSDKKP
ncbi:hypothetical protein D3C80_783900 [compost metagenome]